jgi:cbb3-type cytochrome oxidase subunit 3
MFEKMIDKIESHEYSTFIYAALVIVMVAFFSLTIKWAYDYKNQTVTAEDSIKLIDAIKQQEAKQAK